MKLLLLTLIIGFTNAAYSAAITVSAAASLTDAFTDLASVYESDHPHDKIYLNFAGSGALLQQIIHGAPVDVFASANQWHLQQAEKENLVISQTTHDFAANTLVAIVPNNDTHDYHNIDELINAQTIKRIAISNPEYVPVGRYSKQALIAKNLWQKAHKKQISTQNVRQTLDYVAIDEVDTGFVYQTDARLAADKVRVVFPVETVEPITYQIAILKRSKVRQAAQEFVEFVLSDKGQQILHEYGFLSIH